MLAGRFRLSAATVAVIVLATALPASAGATISGRALTVASVFNYYAAACPTAEQCLAVGQNKRDEGVVTAVSGTRLAKTTAVRGTNSLSAIACANAHICLATGQWHFTTAVLVAIRNGHPAKALRLYGTYLFGIGCGSASSCWATGESGNFRHALFVHLVRDRIAHVYSLHGIPPAAFYFDSSAKPSQNVGGGPPPYCYSATACAAGGTTGGWQNNGQGLVVSLQNGKITSRLKVPGAARIVGLHCTGQGSCLAAGDGRGFFSSGSVVTIAGGRPKRPVEAAVDHLVAFQLSGLGCDRRACFAVGRAGAIVTIQGGRPTEVINAPGRVGFDGVGCSAALCLAAGGQFDPRASGHERGALYAFG